MSRLLLQETAGLVTWSWRAKSKSQQTVRILQEMQRDGMRWAPMGPVIDLLLRSNLRSIWNARVTRQYRELYWHSMGLVGRNDEAWEQEQEIHRELLLAASRQLDPREETRVPRVWERLVQSYANAAAPGMQTGRDVGLFLHHVSGITLPSNLVLEKALRNPGPAFSDRIKKLVLVADTTGRLPMEAAIDLCSVLTGLVDAGAVLCEDTLHVMARRVGPGRPTMLYTGFDPQS
jgi:hypothetical protein